MKEVPQRYSDFRIDCLNVRVLFGVVSVISSIVLTASHFVRQTRAVRSDSFNTTILKIKVIVYDWPSSHSPTSLVVDPENQSLEWKKSRYDRYNQKKPTTTKLTTKVIFHPKGSATSVLSHLVSAPWILFRRTRITPLRIVPPNTTPETRKTT